ncbi:MAG: hypothetical protein U9R32_06425 [Bacteroidota bacterium]|nr:hypothetical protein [Bacteroidota bacterium]
MKKIISYCWIVLIFVVFFVTNLQAQVNYGSPYSRFGIGDINRTNNPVYQSMGGLSIGVKDAFHINYMNPASYTAIDSMSFIVEGGAFSRISEWKTVDESENSEFSSLGNLSIAFPITSSYKMSVGIVPYSNVGYQLTAPTQLRGIGNVNYLYEGNGGINKFYLGGAVNIAKGLSLGVNANYYWGQIDINTYATFPDSTYYFDTKVMKHQEISDVAVDFGLQYEYYFGEDKEWRTVAGIVYSPSFNLSATEEKLTAQMKKGAGGAESINDTISYKSGVSGSITLPSSYGIGFVVEKKDRIKFGVDYKVQDWSSYESFGISDSLKNSGQLSIGMEYLPQNNVLSSYYKKIKYRFGFRYSDTYLQLRDNQLKDIGISFGVGLPVKNSGSSINLGVEFGKRGTTDNSLIEENYIKFTLGISIYERWFVQRKYY